MNREEHLQKIFPTEDGKTYIQSLDEFNSKKDKDKKEDTCRSGGINNVLTSYIETCRILEDEYSERTSWR